MYDQESIRGDFCLFVVIPFSLDVRLHLSANMWTHQPGSHRRKATQEFVNFLLREGFSRSLPSSTVKPGFVYSQHNRSPRENPSSCACTEMELTSQCQMVSRLPTEPPGRPAICVCVCVCVCVFFPFILDIKFVGRTSRGHTRFLMYLLSAVRALIFLARRIQPFLSLVGCEVEFCVLTI